MGIIIEFLKYRPSRNIAKIILLLWAAAISTFSMTSPFLIGILHFDIGLEVRNWLALSSILLFIFVKENLLVPLKLPFLDNTLTKYAYYVMIGILALAISSINFLLLDGILNLTFFDYSLIAVRNFVAVALLFAVRIIHISG